jgi:dihydroorotase
MINYVKSKTFEKQEALKEFNDWIRKNPQAKDYEKDKERDSLKKKLAKISESLNQANRDIILLRKGGFNLEPTK